ncbi:lipopolysaccharide biosynthesis protein [Leifsonia kafniensis]|uniref:Lipopolysaccharide biosynthesis protein n=1 Tax=Leifsonia kafniensis TaxID=475957 RepID=A0ABP7L8S7_9MICO
MSSLGQKAVRGGSITLLGQGIKLILQLGGLIVLGRILPPEQFGLVAMVTAISGLADVLRDMGLSSAAIQAKTLSRGQQSNLFWLNSSLGLALGFAALVLAGPIADFYGDDRLIGITMALAPMFLFNGVQTQFQATLARNLQFRALMFTDILSLAVGLAGAIALALIGAGYWALVGQLVLQSLTLLLGRVAVARWFPGLPDRSAPTRRLLTFGANLMATQLLVYASSSIPSVLVGARSGAQALGFYSRASQLVTFPINQLFTPITNVALPVLSRSQDDRERFDRHLLRSQIALGYIVVLTFAVCIGVADSIIPLVFGEEWAPSAPLFQILAIGGAFQAVSYPTYWVFLARGLTGSHLRYSLISRSIVIVSVLIGSVSGVYGVALGYVIGVAIGWPLSLLWLRGHDAGPIRAMFGNGLRVILVGSVVALAGLGISRLTVNDADILRVVYALLICAGTTVLLAFVVPDVRRDRVIIVQTLAHLKPGSSAGGK